MYVNIEYKVDPMHLDEERLLIPAFEDDEERAEVVRLIKILGGTNSDTSTSYDDHKSIFEISNFNATCSSIPNILTTTTNPHGHYRQFIKHNKRDKFKVIKK
jgi:hypothetical protein